MSNTFFYCLGTPYERGATGNPSTALERARSSRPTKRFPNSEFKNSKN